MAKKILVKPVYKGHCKKTMCPSVAVALYIQVKITCSIHKWKNEIALYRQ